MALDFNLKVALAGIVVEAEKMLVVNIESLPDVDTRPLRCAFVHRIANLTFMYYLRSRYLFRVLQK